jgi:ABC-type nitrate/sulfonate/bicarbonate transport system permease component
MGLGTARGSSRRARGSSDLLSTPASPSNNLFWRVTVLEKEMERMKEAKPEVVADRVTRIAEDITAIKSELATQRRILVGAFISIAVGLIIAIAVSSPVT